MYHLNVLFIWMSKDTNVWQGVCVCVPAIWDQSKRVKVFGIHYLFTGISIRWQFKKKLFQLFLLAFKSICETFAMSSENSFNNSVAKLTEVINHSILMTSKISASSLGGTTFHKIPSIPSLATTLLIQSFFIFFFTFPFFLHNLCYIKMMNRNFLLLLLRFCGNCRNNNFCLKSHGRWRLWNLLKICNKKTY